MGIADNYKTSYKGSFLLISVFIYISIMLHSGCSSVVKDRYFINDGSITRYELSSYTELDSTVNSLNCDTVITLERSGCLGKCPVFELALLSNGQVIFQGRHNVNRMGIYDTLFNKDDLMKLVDEFNRSGFIKLRDNYDLTNCSGPSDLSSLVISIKTNNVNKRVRYYIGCLDYQQEGRLMTHLADRIEAISNVKDLIR